ncbi:MAG: MaoC family dehydratase N-terminal domain-containing protein [Marinicaulis sp.]|nr:MaoC family dehydratase N-terminal domain-containing protein [Marinicaulis sp.]
MTMIENHTYDEIQIGDKASIIRILTEKDIALFAAVSGDVNPTHLDEEYARSSLFHELIGHGMWGGALISTVLGTQLPGPGAIYLSQTLKFREPVKIGDKIKVEVCVREKADGGRVIFDCQCRNQLDAS